MAEKKIAFYAICETYSSLLNHGAVADVTLPMSFKKKYHVEVSEEGERVVLQEMKGMVMRYMSENAVIDDLVAYSHLLPDEYKAFKLDHEKAKKIMKYWKAITPNFPHKIKPILQKDTSGYTFHRLDFNMVKMETPTFDYLLEALDTNQEAFLAYIGALFDPGKTQQQYLWLSGGGGDGKGSLFRLLHRIFNHSYVSITTENRHIDKYWQSSLIGKRLAVCGDTKNLDFINSSIFMQVSGGDHVTVRPMYARAYTAELNTMFIFGANADPAITTEDSSQRRAIICKVQRGGDGVFIDGYEEKLWEERAGIVYRCMEAWRKVRHLIRIPVDEESLQNLGEDTEEMHQQLVDRYFEVGEGLSIPSSTVITILKEGEKRPPTNIEMGAWKRFLVRAHGIKFGRDRAEGRQTKMYLGLGEKDVTDSEDRF